MREKTWRCAQATIPRLSLKSLEAEDLVEILKDASIDSVLLYAFRFKLISRGFNIKNWLALSTSWWFGKFLRYRTDDSVWTSGSSATNTEVHFLGTVQCFRPSGAWVWVRWIHEKRVSGANKSLSSLGPLSKKWFAWSPHPDKEALMSQLQGKTLEHPWGSRKFFLETSNMVEYESSVKWKPQQFLTPWP